MHISMNIEEVREATGIGRTKIYEAINHGLLRAKKYGKRTIILREDLDDFLSNLEPYSSKNPT